MCVWGGVGRWIVAVEAVCMERVRFGLQVSRSSLSVGHRAKGSFVRSSWWHANLALDWNISCMPLSPSTPVPSLSMPSINDKSPHGL